MKKLKSLKTLSSLGAIAAITPIVATACNSDDSSSTDENNIGSFYWSSNGDYLNNMSQDQIIEVFKANNVAGVNDLPEDIYSNVTITANQIEETWTSVTVSANSDSKYKGKKTVNITVKTALSDFTDWTERKGLHDYYKRLGTKTLIVATFILNHPAGEHGLPADIYDDVDVKASHDTWEWVVTITPNAKCNK